MLKGRRVSHLTGTLLLVAVFWGVALGLAIAALRSVL